MNAKPTRGWRTSAPFRMGFYVMGLVCGAGLVLSGVIQIWLIYRLRLDASVVVTNRVALSAFALIGSWNVWFIARPRHLARCRVS